MYIYIYHFMTLLEPGTIELFRKVRNVEHLPKSQRKREKT